jgi:hypothetical protein
VTSRIIARWEAKGGRRYLVLYVGDLGYFYRGDGCGGGLPAMPNDDAAIEYMERPWGQGGAGPVTVLRSDFPSVRRVV